ncbi:hypothetical protein GGS21DRAFT_333351 [Xylaria nigripes]|nr:hypothetical protein GGS21DRAFT_333351 [Xylaria nigripes]
MKATLISAALLAVLVSADTTTTAATTTTTCAAQAILDACLDTTEGYLVLCGSQDYSCLCDKYNAIMTCFANCPYDDRQYAISSQRDLYCMDASAFQTKTTTNSWSKTTAGSTATHAATTGTADDSDDASPTSNGDDDDETSSTAPPRSTAHLGGAAGGQSGSSGLLTALAGIVFAAFV